MATWFADKTAFSYDAQDRSVYVMVDRQKNASVCVQITISDSRLPWEDVSQK